MRALFDIDWLCLVHRWYDEYALLRDPEQTAVTPLEQGPPSFETSNLTLCINPHCQINFISIAHFIALLNGLVSDHCCCIYDRFWLGCWLE